MIIVTKIPSLRLLAFLFSLLPPFIDQTSPILPQMVVMLSIVLTLEFSCLIAYASGGQMLRHLLLKQGNVRLLNRITGTLMIGIGIFGYILRKLDFPLSPVLLGFILGGLMEQNLRRALSISNGALEILWSSPITLGVWMLTVVMLLLPIVRIWRKRSAQRRALANA